jgi:hypothetical protein
VPSEKINGITQIIALSFSQILASNVKVHDIIQTEGIQKLKENVYRPA